MSNTKKKKRRVLLISVAAVAFAAAAAVLVYYFVNRDDISKLATATLADIVSDSRIPDKEYSNLDFTKAVLNLPNADKAYKFKPAYEDKYTSDECTEKCYEMFDAFFPFLKSENDDMTYTDFMGNPLPQGTAYLQTDIAGEFMYANLGFTDNDGNYYNCDFHDNGRFYIYEDPVSGMASLGTEIDVVHLDRGETVPDKTYLVGGEEYSPAQALTFAEKTIDEKVSKFIDNVDVTPTELLIIKDDESDNYAFKIQFEYVYENIPFFHLTLDNSSADNQSYMSNGVIYISINAPNRIGEIYNTYVSPEVVNEGQYEDKYIPLDKAADLASEYLAPYFKQKISEVTIKYSKNNKQGDTVLRPYWCFIIDEDNHRKTQNPIFLVEYAIFVDMQTGEVIAHLDVNEK